MKVGPAKGLTREAFGGGEAPQPVPWLRLPVGQQVESTDSGLADVALAYKEILLRVSRSRLKMSRRIAWHAHLGDAASPAGKGSRAV